MIKTKESRRKIRRRKQELQDLIEGVVLPEVCASFLAKDTSLLPYLVGSNLFFIVLFSYVYFNRESFFPVEPDQTKQAIDIEFVSDADFKDKHDILPATEPKPTLGKRVSPVNKIIVSGTSIPLEQSRSQPTKPQHRELVYAINCQQHTSADSTNSVARLPAKSKIENETLAVNPIKTSSAELQLEEMAPLAMTEVKDNEGDNSLELWQDGGRSIAGLGTPSPLSNYLKQLHEKLKHTWSPPSGPMRQIKVLFRLAPDGNIVSLKLVSSSGDIEADNSALEAVNKAAPFGKLPKDYTSPFLDLAYTFNYSTDELNEVPPPKVSSSTE